MTMCVVGKGDFPITISWTLNDKPLNNVEGVIIANNNKRSSQITIESVQAQHMGEYKCIAKNKVGLSEFSTYLNVNGIVLL